MLILKRWYGKEKETVWIEIVYVILVNTKIAQTVQLVHVFSVVGCKDDSSVNSTDYAILLDEENEYPEVAAVDPSSA